MRSGFARHLRSVRARITIAATLVFAVAFIAAAWGLARTVDRRVHSSARSAAEAEVHDLKDQVLSTRRLSDVRPLSHAVYFQFFDYQTRQPLVGNVPPGTALLRFDSNGTPHPAKLDGVKGEMLFSLPTRVYESSIDASPTFWLVVASSLEGADKSVTTLRHGLLLATPILILLVALMTWFFVSRALLPVESIRREVEEIRGTTMDRR